MVARRHENAPYRFSRGITAPLELRILGSLEATGPNGPIEIKAAKPRGLLALLALSANEVVSAVHAVESEQKRSAVSWAPLEPIRTLFADGNSEQFEHSRARGAGLWLEEAAAAAG